MHLTEEEPDRCIVPKAAGTEPMAWTLLRLPDRPEHLKATELVRVGTKPEVLAKPT